jgi:monodehydroascorbate reductase (NADH)
MLMSLLTDCRYVIVGGGNAAGYAARTFVEHGMADGRLCIVSKEVLLFG